MAKTYRNNAKRLGNYVYDTRTGKTYQMNDNTYKQAKEQFLSNARKQEKQESWFEMPDENLGTLGNLFVSGVEGLGQVGNAILGQFESVDDFRRNRIADVQELFGYTAAAEKTRRQAEQEWSAPIIGKYGKELQEATEGLDEYSVFGGKADTVFQGVGSSILAQGLAVPGQVAGSILGFGTKGMNALGSVSSLGSMGVGSAGSGETQARMELRAMYPDMSTEEINRRARTYGAITGTGEVLSEMMFGGISKASNTLGIGKGVFDSFDDAIAQGLTKHIDNQILRTLIQSGIKASGEGVEEIVSGLFEIAGKKLALMDSTDIMTMIQDESLLDAFLSGTLSAAITQAPGVITNIQNTNNGIYRDYVSGLSENEQKVVDAVTEARIGEQELSTKEKNKIRNDIKDALLEGRLSSSEINKSLKEQLQGNPADVYLHNIMRNESSAFDVLEEERNKVKTKNQENLLNEIKNLNLNNAQEIHDIYNTLNAIQGVNDSVQYHLTTTEDLYQKGMLEKNAKGEYTLKGEKYIPRGITVDGNNIYVNADVGAKSGTQAMYHEMFEAFKSTSPQEYNEFKQMVKDIVGEEAIQKEIEEYRKMYNMKENSEGLTNDVEDEIINDKFGEIAESEEFLNRIAENRTLLQKFIDKIRDFIKYLKGTQQEKSLIKLRQNLEKKFNELYKGTQFKSTKGNTAFSIAGIEGINNLQDSKFKTAALENYKKAQEMAKNSESNEKIRQETKWFKDKNGQWKFEIDDSGITLNNNILQVNHTYKLGDIIKHDALFKLYPFLKNYTVEFANIKKTGAYNRLTNGIKLNNDFIRNSNYKELKGTILHEVQHAIQQSEGFESGMSSKLSKKAYYNKLGEIEASDTKNRYLNDFTKEDRMKYAPESSKENPKHAMYDQYMKDRGVVDTVKDTLYPLIERGVENVRKNQETNQKNNQEDNGLVVGGEHLDNVQYSLTKDSQGRELSKEQQEFFKDVSPKLKDKDGNLLVFYHGTPNGEYNEFKPGSYFSTNKEYAEGYQNTWASSISSGKVETTPKTYEVYLNITNPFSIQDAAAKDIYLNEYVKGGNSLFLDPYSDYTDYINGLEEIDWTEGEDLKEWLQENHPEYDGLILDEGGDGGYGEAEYRWRGKSYLPFKAEQVKNVDNASPTSNPDIRYSLTVSEANTGVDNQGRELTKEQQDYFKESKATDESGNLIEVYHTTTGYTHQFNEFNPLGDNFYKFGDTTVNYYTDSKEMSDSYGYNSIAPVTQRIESMDDVNKVIGDRFRVEENNGQYNLYDGYDESVIKTYEDVIKLFNQEEQDILNKTFNKSRSEVRDMLNNNEEQFDFYDKTRTKWFNTFAVLEDTSKMTAGDVRKTSDEIIDNYLNGKKQTPIKTFKDTQDLYRNITETVSPYEHYQYEGYLNITNPYIIDAEGQNWNRIQNPNALEYKNQIKEKWDIPERQLDRLEGNTLKEFNRDLSKLGWQIKKDQYGDLGLFSRDSELAIDLLNVNDVLQEIRADLDNDLKTALTTNDIVFQALNENNFGANYNGVIIKNVVDYGEHVSGEQNPHDVYVTFNSNQFKAVDNTNPTNDADIRYSLKSMEDSEMDKITPQQYEYFKNTKAVDDLGELEVVHHGTTHDFNIFDIEKAGETGLQFGNGFYFTNSRGKALGFTEGGLYGDNYDQVKSGYVNIEKPASRDTKTMTFDEFKALYNALNTDPNMWMEDMEMSGIDALLSDYGDIYNDKERAIKTFYESYDNDVNLIDNLSYMYNPTEMYKVLRDVTGYDGIIIDNPSGYDAYEKYYVAFNPDQFKLKSNENPTNNVDMRLSLTKAENQKYNGIAPYNENQTFGQQVQEAVAPLQEQIQELSDTINELKDNVAPTLETPTEEQPAEDFSDVQINYEPFMDMINGLGENQSIREQQAQKVDAKQTNRINKPKGAKNFLKRAFVNEFATVDEFAQTHNAPQIKYKADTYNNYQPIAQSNIEHAQTDFNGKEIGRSWNSIWQVAEKKGLTEALNDYLIQWSNLDRQRRGKGTEVSYEQSKKMIEKYDAAYPELKPLAKDVWQYFRNYRHGMRDTGYISAETSNVLGHSDPHYIPFISDGIENYYTDSKEIKPRRTIKRAKGGAESGMLLPVQEAGTRYTYSVFNTVFGNDLYRDIIKASNDIVRIGADTRNNYVDNADNLFMDENGYYITAYENGEPITGRISEDMYKTLSRQMNSTIKDIEQKLSFVTKPLQKLSRLRRDILTKYSPTFPIKNVTKDVQDAEFNSKYTLDFNKEYANPNNWYELATNKGDAQQFRSLYGGGLEMGMFNVDSGLYNAKKGLKNFNFLKGIENVNELMELAPRYAEFKASLKNGATIQEAMYNAREVTTNFSRGGVIAKALNRNGFTFLNASIQGFDKFIRNFSGENGAKGVANSLLKAAMFGVAPAVFNELVFGWGDDKDEEYEALPSYIKDNYYLIKMSNGEFIRIPKGRMLSVFGSAARRTLEMAQGDEDAFKGYLSNVNNQIGINNPEENNIFAPMIQAFGSKNGNAWYGGDIVPTRLQDKPTGEQYDESTDKLSIWLGEKTGISPYKLNYVLDQYTGGIGDLILPYMTEESNTSAEGIGRALAPIKDQFVVDSTYDNKYVSNFYSKKEEITTKANGSKATDEDQLQKKYLDSISKQMTELYAEKREIQSNPDLSKTEKYEKATEIKKEINRLAKEGLENYQNVSKDGDYASVGDNDYQKTEDGWKKVSSKGSDDMNSMGLNNKEKSQYTKTQTELNNIKNKYKGSSSEADSINKRTEIINTITTSNLSDDAKVQLYKNYYSDNMVDDYVTMGMNVDSYLNYKKQNFTADKYANGKSISGSKKQKVFDYINSMNIPYEQKLILAKEQYNSWNDGNAEIIQYLNNNKNVDYQTMEDILKHLGFKVENGNISW